MLIFDGPDHAVRRVFGPAGDPSRPVVVTFPHAGWATWDRGPAFAEPFLRHKGFDAYHVLNRRPNWFQTDDFLPALAAIRADLPPGRPVVTYGASMGGFGALIASGPLDAVRVLAVAPQVSVDPAVVPWEIRWRHHRRAITAFPHRVQDLMSPRAQVVTLHDPRSRDARHIAALPFGPRRTDLALPHGGHTPLVVLQQAGVLSGFASSVLAGSFDAADLQRRLLAARRASPIYWGNLARAALDLGRTGLARAALDELDWLPAEPAEIEKSSSVVLRAAELWHLRRRRTAAVERGRAERLARRAEVIAQRRAGARG